MAGAPAAAPTLEQMQRVFLQAVRQVVANTEDVGTRFPEEARKIHHGEAPARGIRGQATEEEREELRDEGIEVYSLPIPEALKGPPTESARTADSQHPVRVQASQRVQRRFDLAHQAQGHRRLVLRQLLALERANAVLGRDRAAETADRVVDQRVESLFVGRQEGGGRIALGAWTL
jgi:hypothetical protein